MNGGHLSPDASARLSQAGDVMMRLGGLDTRGMQDLASLQQRLRAGAPQGPSPMPPNLPEPSADGPPPFLGPDARPVGSDPSYAAWYSRRYRPSFMDWSQGA